MIHYLNGIILRNELPEETVLIIALSDNEGGLLKQNLPEIMKDLGKQITCICFAGETSETHELLQILKAVHKAGLKTCMYTKYTEMSQINLTLLDDLDYVGFGYSKTYFGMHVKNRTKKDYSPFGDTDVWIDI